MHDRAGSSSTRRARVAVGTLAVTLASLAVPMAQATPALAVEVGSCSIATITWDGGGDTTDWSTDANWNPDRQPGASDHVCIPAAAPQASVVLGAGVTVRSVEATKPLTVGGTLEVTSTTQASSLAGSTVAGTLTGAGAKSLGGDSSWTGVISGSGPVTVPVGGTLTAPTNCGTLDGSTLTNLGTLSLSSTFAYGCVELINGAVIENAGTLALGDTPGYYSAVLTGTGGGTLHNTGTITTPGTNATGRYLYSLDNDGTVNATRDLIVNSGAGVSTGTFTAAAGATLTVTDATVGGATITGAGGVHLAGTVTATGAGLSVTTGHANVVGTLTGPGAKSLGGDSSWTGVISGSGPVTVPVGGTLTAPTNCGTLDGSTLTNLGTLSLASTFAYGCVELINGAVIENAGTLALGDTPGYYSAVLTGTGGGTLHNTGTITTPGTNATGRYLYSLDNDGTVNATRDLIVNSGAGVSTGTFTAAAGATLTVTDATVGGATITGAGGVHLAGTVTATGAGLSVTTGHANVVGTLTGPGAKSLGGDSSWTGVISGSGPVTVPVGGTLTAPTNCGTLDGSTLTNLGTLSLASTFAYGCVELINGAVIENAGTLALGDTPGYYSAVLTGTGGGTLHNTGTITTPGTNATGRYLYSLDNDGTVNATRDLTVYDTANYSATTQTLARGVLVRVKRRDLGARRS